MNEQTEQTDELPNLQTPAEFPVGAWIDYLISTHPDFFLPRRGAWVKRTDEATRDLVHRIDHAIMAHWIDEQSKVVINEDLSKLDGVKRCIALVQGTIVSQRLLDIELNEDELRRIDFRHTGFSRLLRGVTNCEGMSHILFELLRKIGVTASIFEVMDDEGCARHNLLKVDMSEGWCFADAWARFSLYSVAGLYPEKSISGVPELASIETDHASADGLFPKGMYFKGWVPGTRYYPRNPLPIDSTPPELSPIDVPDTSWQALLRARKAHVLNPFAQPVDYLELLKAHRYGGMTRELIIQLAALPPMLAEDAKSSMGEGSP